jgi:hypothetical protein
VISSILKVIQGVVKVKNSSGTVIDPSTETTLAAQSTLMGAVNETAPASDTASSGANGRLQRIAQRLTSLITAVTDRTQKSQITDGTRDGTVKAASTPVDTADTALVVGQSPFNFLAVTTAATITVKSGAGVLHSVCICAPANGSLTIYNNTAASGTIIAVVNATNGTAPSALIFDIKFSIGLTVVSSSATPEWTICYK